MKRVPSIGLLVVTAVLLLAAGVVNAGTFVDLKGDFYFDYPEDWMEIDHRVVDLHLRANQAGETTLDYDAAFAPKVSSPFYSGAYFILTVDTMSSADAERSIDSVLNDMNAKFGKRVKYYPVADFLADMKSNAPSYDADKKTINVINDIVEGDVVVKRHLLVRKFFERGLASFYFYAPDSLFAQAEPTFNKVLASFHSGGAEAMLPKENLKVADLGDVSKKPPVDDDSTVSRFGIPTAVLVVLGIIVLAGYRRRKNR